MTTLSDGVLDFSFRRSSAMMLRYWYLLRSSWPRLVDLVYWPTVQMITWGFLQFYIVQNAGFFAQAAGTFIGAVLLWDILFRGQLGFSISFMEEMWARNIGNLMMSPLRPFEFITALMAMSVVRLAIGTIPVTFLAIAFFGFNLYGLGLALVAFFINLMLTSWAVGIFVSGLVLRNGLGAENLAWSIMLSPVEATRMLESLLTSVPLSKIRWGGDCYYAEESYGAYRQFRRVLSQALTALVATDRMTSREAVDGAAVVLCSIPSLYQCPGSARV